MCNFPHPSFTSFLFGLNIIHSALFPNSLNFRQIKYNFYSHKEHKVKLASNIKHFIVQLMHTNYKILRLLKYLKL